MNIEKISQALGWYFYQSEDGRRLLDRVINSLCQLYGIPVSEILIKLHEAFGEVDAKK